MASVEIDKPRKTYKREVSFALMSVVIFLTFWSAFATTTAHAEHLFNLAKFLMPFASALLAGAFGADWWSKEMKPGE